MYSFTWYTLAGFSHPINNPSGEVVDFKSVFHHYSTGLTTTSSASAVDEIGFGFVQRGDLFYKGSLHNIHIDSAWDSFISEFLLRANIQKDSMRFFSHFLLKLAGVKVFVIFCSLENIHIYFVVSVLLLYHISNDQFSVVIDFDTKITTVKSLLCDLSH